MTSFFARIFLGMFIIFIFRYGNVTCQKSPSISFISQETYGRIGKTVELNCTVAFADDFNVLWLKYVGNEMTPLSSGTEVIFSDRFSVTQEKASSTSTYSLRIKDIQEIDSGIYKCQIRMSVTEMIEAPVELKILHPPVISDNSTNSMILYENSSTRLECYAEGFPTPKIIWRRQNNALLPTGRLIHKGNILEIPSVKKSDRGTYYCIADNLVGHGTQRRIDIEVHFVPEIRASRPRLGQALLFDLDLECSIEAFPPPAIIWKKDGEKLINNQHYRISQMSYSDDNVGTILRIRSIEKKQYGEYTCSAENSLGSNETKLEVFETIVPMCPPACDVTFYGAGVLPTYSGTLLASTLIFALAFKHVFPLLGTF